MSNEQHTPGPVKVLKGATFSGSEDYPYMVVLDYGVGPCAPNVVACRMLKVDAEFVAAMWNSFAALTAERDKLREALEWIVQPDIPIGSNAEFAMKARIKAESALAALAPTHEQEPPCNA